MIWTLLAHWVHLFLSGFSILLGLPFVKSFLFVFHNFLSFLLLASTIFTHTRIHPTYPKFRIDTCIDLWYKLYVRF